MNPERPVLLGRGGGDGVCDEEVVVLLSSLRVRVGKDDNGSAEKGPNGKADMSNTSPESITGRILEYLEVRISRASVRMGFVDGMARVRGWMVIQSTLRL